MIEKRTSFQLRILSHEKQYNFKLQILLGLIFLLGLLNNILAQQDAFPGAEGYGRYTTGGRGGDVYHVTNLDNDGAGSLRYGIENANGPRTIVFDISGTIQINGGLEIESANITIAGQTTPGDGVTLAGGALNIQESNIIVRYIRCRLGDMSGGDDDAVHIDSGSNIIFDHVTASWSVDETLSCQSETVDSITVQWCMVTESLNYSHHEKGRHGYGSIIGAHHQTFHHNLYAHHSARSPKVTWRRHCKVDCRNNVIYNWGARSCHDGSSGYMNWVNNYYKPGPSTSVRNMIFQLNDIDTSSSYVNGVPYYLLYETALFAEGNYVVGYPDITANNWNGGIHFTYGAIEAEHRALTAFDFPVITEQTALEAYPLVLESAGASLVRDSIDNRIIKEVFTGTTTYKGSKTGTPGLIDSQNDVGGWPILNSLPAPTDTDQDGMPDLWETARGLNINDASDRNGDDDSDGYTNLEEYLNELVVSETGFLHTLTVSSGSGSGNFAEGRVVSISADVPIAGYVFDKWTGDIANVANVNSANTFVYMPSKDISLTAYYVESTGINNNVIDDKTFLCYPNPTSSSFSIDLSLIGNSNIDIYNSIGESVYNKVSTNSIEVITDHNLISGIYFIKVTDRNKNIYSQKLMIK